MEKRKTFTAEFKREAVRLLKSAGKPAAVVARELGIPRNRLYKWAQDADNKGEKAFGGSGRPKASTDELAVLKRENARLQQAKKGVKEHYRFNRLCSLPSGQSTFCESRL